MLLNWLAALVDFLTTLAPEGSMLQLPGIVRGLLAVVLVCLVCGAVGSLVVGNRMSFFSDALAHCAFAGVTLGLLTGLALGVAKEEAFEDWGIPLIMVVFGALTGLGIAYVKENTVLANDTVIGVFFAGAVGFGAMFFKALNVRSRISPETFLFGDPLYVTNPQLLVLILLLLCTLGMLPWLYNRFVFTSFNASLARSRQIPMRLFNYVFIVLLALIVNVTFRAVGALLINAMLIVPAATAGNLSRNMRQMFWGSIGLSLFAGIVGGWLSTVVGFHDPVTGETVNFGWGGTIVVLSVFLFFVSMIAGPFVRGRQTA